jgi:hypothetical protein
VTRNFGLFVFVASGFLLLTMGGAIVAAPVTLSLMFLAARRHPTRGFRLAAAVLGGLTAAEAFWALAYVTIGEARPWIWLAPLVTAAGVGRLLGRRSAPAAGMATVTPVSRPGC